MLIRVTVGRAVRHREALLLSVGTVAVAEGLAEAGIIDDFGEFAVQVVVGVCG